MAAIMANVERLKSLATILQSHQQQMVYNIQAITATLQEIDDTAWTEGQPALLLRERARLNKSLSDSSESLRLIGEYLRRTSEAYAQVDRAVASEFQ